MNAICGNYWIWTDVELEKLIIPEGMTSKPHLYGPEENYVEYLLLNNKGREIAVLDSSPVKKNIK